MSEKPIAWGRYGPNYLRKWREDRQHTQESLAVALGTDKGVISLLETGKRKLDQEWLRKLAEVLNCSRGDILDTDPDSLPDEIRTSWLRANATQRRQIAAVAEQIVKYGGADE